MLESSRHASRVRNRRPPEQPPQLITLTRLTLKQCRQLKADLGSAPFRLSPKKVHQLRVLSRRNRASFEVLCGMAPSLFTASLKILKNLTRKLGELRSLDVYRNDLKKLCSSYETSSTPDFVTLQNYLDQKLKKQRKAHHHLLEKWAEHALSKHLHPETLKEAMAHCSPADFYSALQQQEKDTLKRLHRRWVDYQKRQSFISLHEVRIALKRWRYLLELQEECLPTGNTERTHGLKKLQDALGALNDRHSLYDFLLDKKIRKKIQKQKLIIPYQTLLQTLETDLQYKMKLFQKERIPQIESLIKGAPL